MKTNDVIKFYIREEPYGFLSNFWRAEQCITYNNEDTICYPTNEHFYQSQKAKNVLTWAWIARAPNAWAAMKAGRELRPHEIVDNWESKKVHVMLTGLRAKFGSRFNVDLKNQLLETGDAILIEDSPTDMFWGGSLPGSQNMLGTLLMQVREELSEVKI